MKDTNYIFRRIGAYIIDGVVVAVLTTLIASIGFINPYKAKNDEMTKKYSDLYKDSIQVVSDINKYLEDDKISVEELEELKKFDSLKPIFEEYTEEINKDEAKKLTDKVASYYTNTYNQDAREIKRLAIVSDIVNICLLVIYFMVLPIFTKGVTIGKSIFKLKVVKEDGKEATFVDYLIRGVILYGIVFSIISIVFGQTLSANDFYKYDEIVGRISNGVLLLTFGFMVFRKDCRSLHDLASRTTVISTKEEKKEEETEEIKEEKVTKVENKKEVKEAKVEPVKKKKKTTKKK